MSKEDDAERAQFSGRIIPARPKGAPASAELDPLISKRKAVWGPVTFVEPESNSEVGSAAGLLTDDLTAFHSFTLILRTLKKFPKKTQKEMIGLITEMLLTE